MKKIYTYLLTAVMALMPMAAFAQGELGQVSAFLQNIVDFINGTLVPLLFVVAFLFFIWGMFQYFIRGGHDQESQEKGKQLIVYSVIGFVLMISIWGIVNIVASGLGLNQDLDSSLIPNTPDINNR